MTSWRVGSCRTAMVLAMAIGAVTACVPPPTTGRPTITSFAAVGGPHEDPALVPLTWTVKDPNGDQLSCRLDADGDGVWDHTITNCPRSGSRNVEVAAGDRTARLEVSDGAHTTVGTAAYTVAPASVTEPMDIEIRASTPMDADVLAAFEAAAARWESAVVRGLSDLPVTLAAGQCSVGSAPFDGTVDDLVVDVSVRPTPPYAAIGGPCLFGPDHLPRYGAVQVDPDFLPFARDFGMLDEIALHELAHVLGFGTIWNFHRALISGEGTSDQRFVGPRAMAEYSQLGGAGGVPVGSVDGVATGHWHSDFGIEIITSVGDGSPLSRLTIASIADLGYHVDLDVADAYELPGTAAARRSPATSLDRVVAAPPAR